MIDLNRKPAKPEDPEEPLGIVILGCLPFAFGLWWIITQGLINGL